MCEGYMCLGKWWILEYVVDRLLVVYGLLDITVKRELRIIRIKLIYRREELNKFLFFILCLIIL